MKWVALRSLQKLKIDFGLTNNRRCSELNSRSLRIDESREDYNLL